MKFREIKNVLADTIDEIEVVLTDECEFVTDSYKLDLSKMSGSHKLLRAVFSDNVLTKEFGDREVEGVYVSLSGKGFLLSFKGLSAANAIYRVAEVYNLEVKHNEYVNEKGEGHTMEMKNVNSSQIAAIGYESGVLVVRFNTGAVYSYSEVPFKVYTDMLQADSVGHYLNESVKPNYKFTKLTA